jgi:hypothetical protein
MADYISYNKRIEILTKAGCKQLFDCKVFIDDVVRKYGKCELRARNLARHKMVIYL